MTTSTKLVRAVLAAGIALALCSPPAAAGKPDWEKGASKGQGGKRDKEHGQRKEGKEKHAKGSHFRSEHQSYVRSYYDGQFKSGHCPPGLAKKRNGCLPPGQAKKWSMGKPLPSSVTVYEVPRDLVIKIGLPPVGYEYVRVASDILMIAVGTRMVADAITDLGRR